MIGKGKRLRNIKRNLKRLEKMREKLNISCYMDDGKNYCIVPEEASKIYMTSIYLQNDFNKLMRMGT